MNAEDFIPYLLKTTDDPAVQQLLTSLGVKKAPKIKRDDNEARVALADLGIELIFISPEDIRTGPLELSAVLVYGNTQGAGFTPYAGPLPSGLSFTDTRDEARRKAGEPAAANLDMDRDTWDYPTHSMTLDYRVGGAGIVYIDLSRAYVPEDD